MTKRIVLLSVASMLGVLLWVPNTNAAESEAAQVVTQGELAHILVNVLGLARFLPAAPTDQECIEVLMQNNISPADGWHADRIVKRGDLARVIVQGMKRQNEVENPEDPNSWILFLESIGVPIGTIGEATDNLEPLTEPVAPHVIRVAATTDPLKRGKTGEPDETEYGTDMEFVASMRPVTMGEVRAVVAQVQHVEHKKKKKPVTPST